MFKKGQYYLAELPASTANDAVGRQMAISSVRDNYMQSPTFGAVADESGFLTTKAAAPAMLVVMVPEEARDEVRQRIQDILTNDPEDLLKVLDQRHLALVRAQAEKGGH